MLRVQATNTRYRLYSFQLVDLVTRSAAGNTVDAKFCLRGWIMVLCLGKRWDELRKVIETLLSMSEANKVYRRKQSHGGMLRSLWWQTYSCA